MGSGCPFFQEPTAYQVEETKAKIIIFDIHEVETVICKGLSGLLMQTRKANQQ